MKKRDFFEYVLFPVRYLSSILSGESLERDPYQIQNVVYKASGGYYPSRYFEDPHSLDDLGVPLTKIKGAIIPDHDIMERLAFSREERVEKREPVPSSYSVKYGLAYYGNLFGFTFPRSPGQVYYQWRALLGMIFGPPVMEDPYTVHFRESMWRYFHTFPLIGAPLPMVPEVFIPMARWILGESSSEVAFIDAYELLYSDFTRRTHSSGTLDSLGYLYDYLEELGERIWSRIKFDSGNLISFTGLPYDPWVPEEDFRVTAILDFSEFRKDLNLFVWAGFDKTEAPRHLTIVVNMWDKDGPRGAIVQVHQGYNVGGLPRAPDRGVSCFVFPSHNHPALIASLRVDSPSSEIPYLLMSAGLGYLEGELSPADLWEAGFGMISPLTVRSRYP